MASTIEFLSDGWFDALARQLAGAAVSDGPVFVLGQTVTAVPPGDDEVSYSIRLGGGRAPSVERGSAAGADVVFVVTYSDARALATGAAPPVDLIASGRLKIRGDAKRLVEAAAALQQTAEVTSSLHGIVT